MKKRGEMRDEGMNVLRQEFLKNTCGIGFSAFPHAIPKAVTATSIYDAMETHSNNETIFQKILEDYVEAWNKRDIQKWSQIFTEDVDYVNRGGGWWKSNQENIEGHREIFEKISALPRTYKAQIEKIAMLKNDVALLHVRWTWPGANGAASPNDLFNGIMSLVLTKKNGTWLIRSVHNTVSG